MSKIQNRLREIFLKIIKTDLKYNGTVDEIDYFNLYFKTASQDALYRLMGSNFIMLNFSYEAEDAVLMIFSIPINSDSGTKHISERVMEIIGNTERCFITLDYSDSKEVRDDKFVYVTIVKKYSDKTIEFIERELAKKPKKEKVNERKKIKNGVQSNKK